MEDLPFRLCPIFVFGLFFNAFADGFGSSCSNVAFLIVVQDSWYLRVLFPWKSIEKWMSYRKEN